MRKRRVGLEPAAAPSGCCCRQATTDCPSTLLLTLQLPSQPQPPSPPPSSCLTSSSWSSRRSNYSTRKRRTSKIPIRFILLLTVIYLLSKHTGTAALSDEKRLIKRLIDNYTQAGKIGRPVKSQNETLRVEYGLSLIQIMDLDEKNQILTTNVWCKYKWLDHFLTWSESDFGGVKQIRIPINYIWKPDFVLYNYADERLTEHRDAMAVITSDGSVTWIPPAIFKSTCEIDTTNFPFDEQNCSMKFGSWTYNGNALDPFFFESKEYIALDDYVRSQEWIILEHWAHKNIQIYECCPNEPYPDLTFYLRLRRKAAFYNYILILPCVLLSTITMVLFMLPPESPAKMQLGINIFVAFFLLLLLLKDTTPPASHRIPLIGAYYCFNMIMTTVSTFLCAVVVDMHFRADKRSPPPRWLKTLMIDVAARAMCIRVPKPKKPQPGQPVVIGGATRSASMGGSTLAQAGNSHRRSLEATASGAIGEAQSLSGSLRSGAHLGAGQQMSSSTQRPLKGGQGRGQSRYKNFELNELLPSQQEAGQRGLNAPSPSGGSGACMLAPSVSCQQQPLSQLAGSPSVIGGLSQKAAGDGDDQAGGVGGVGGGGDTSPVHFPQSAENEVREIKKLIKQYIQKTQSKEQTMQGTSEWRIISMVLDRIFFYLYIACMIISLTKLFPQPPGDLIEGPRFPNGTAIIDPSAPEH